MVNCPTCGAAIATGDAALRDHLGRHLSLRTGDLATVGLTFVIGMALPALLALGIGPLLTLSALSGR